MLKSKQIENWLPVNANSLFIIHYKIIKTFAAVYCSTQADGLISSDVDYVITFNYHTFLITFKIDLYMS